MRRELLPIKGFGKSDRQPRRGYFEAKRIFDITFSLVALVLSLPLFLIIALVLRARYPEVSVLVGIEVVGRGGRQFRMWKFSTMVKDAELALSRLLQQDPAARQEWESAVKLRKDPRILPGIGTFLRRTSINELPQLWNVLKGEMSLVGPRPIRKEEEAFYLKYGGTEMLRRRNSIRPGITGLWQISGRNDVSYEDRVAIDGIYLDKMSFSIDLKILFETALTILKLRGAY